MRPHFVYDTLQWRIQGQGPGGPPSPPLSLDQTEARRDENKIFETPPLLPPPPPPPLSKGLDLPVHC